MRIFELNAEHGCFSDRSGFYAVRFNFNINARVLYLIFVFIKSAFWSDADCVRSP